jgi:hypothetical protein
MQLATQDGASEENINVEVEYGQNFGSSCGSSNDQIRVTVSLDAGSNSGTEDVSGKRVFCSISCSLFIVLCPFSFTSGLHIHQVHLIVAISASCVVGNRTGHSIPLS